MAKSEFIENIRNGKCKLINKNFIDKELVDIKDLYASIEECHVFTEQDIVNPYLDKLKEKLKDGDYGCRCGLEWWEVRDELFKIIDNLLSEQGDTNDKDKI